MAKPRQKQYAPGPEQVLVEAIFKGIWALVSWPFRRKNGGQKKSGAVPAAVAVELGRHWSEIERHMTIPQTYGLAVAEADKLLDAALQATGVIGQTMGDRLKAAQSLFPKELYEQIWQAHKLRNNLAHEVGVKVSITEAQQAVNTFRSALNYLGVL